MNSKLHHIFAVLVTLSLLGGCKEKLPLDPIYTDDTNWTPFISLFKNDYQRVQIDIEGPPRKELLRNILYYTVEVKDRAAQDFTTIDSLRGTFDIPLYLRDNIYFYYQSPPVFSFRMEYALRFAVWYRGGKVVRSNEIQFVTPIERGKVLRSIPASYQTFPYFYFDAKLSAFSKGKLILLNSSTLFQVDTSSGKATVLKRDFYPQGPSWEGLTACGDTLFIFKPNDYYSPEKKYIIVRFDLNTRALDTLVTLDGTNRWLLKILSHESKLYLFWNLPNVRQQLSVLDPRTGQTLHTFPDVPATSAGLSYPHTLCSDGTNLWMAMNEPFDNKILQVDPHLLVTLKEYHNPVLYPNGLLWDGAHFWTIDGQTSSIVKLQLEGL